MYSISVSAIPGAAESLRYFVFSTCSACCFDFPIVDTSGDSVRETD